MEMSVPHQAHAFISYVRENSEKVDLLAKELRTLGVKVWLDRDNILPGQRWRDAINEAIREGAFFIACYSKEFDERQETYMHGELRVAIDRLRNMPNNRVWFIPVLLNPTEIPMLKISDSETLRDIQAVTLYEDWDEGLRKIVRAMRLYDPDHPRASSPAIGSLRYVIACMVLEIAEDLSQVAGRIEVEIHNDSDLLINFHATTAGNINGKAFDYNKVEFDGYIHPRQSSHLLSHRLVDIPLPQRPNPSEPSLAGLFEYDLKYKAALESEFSRRSARGIQISHWPAIPRKPSETQVNIPTRVRLYNEIEE
jgi:hypothetical protein